MSKETQTDTRIEVRDARIIALRGENDILSSQVQSMRESSVMNYRALLETRNENIRLEAERVRFNRIIARLEHDEAGYKSMIQSMASAGSKNVRALDKAEREVERLSKGGEPKHRRVKAGGK